MVRAVLTSTILIASCAAEVSFEGRYGLELGFSPTLYNRCPETKFYSPYWWCVESPDDLERIASFYEWRIPWQGPGWYAIPDRKEIQ